MRFEIAKVKLEQAFQRRDLYPGNVCSCFVGNLLKGDSFNKHWYNEVSDRECLISDPRNYMNSSYTFQEIVDVENVYENYFQELIGRDGPLDGLDLEDLGDNWDDYVEYLREGARLTLEYLASLDNITINKEDYFNEEG